MSSEALARFRERVLSDSQLQARLRGHTDTPAFIAVVVSLGAELGYEFTADEVQRALVDSQRSFLIGQKRILPWMYPH